MVDFEDTVIESFSLSTKILVPENTDVKTHLAGALQQELSERVVPEGKTAEINVQLTGTYVDNS